MKTQSLHRIRSRLLTLLALAAVLGGAPKVTAQDNTREWPLAPDGFVEIRQSKGWVRVTGWDRDVVALTSEGAEGLSPQATDRQFILRLISAPQDSLVATVDLRVPRTVRLSISGDSLAVDIAQLEGVLDVRALVGDVKVDGAPREVTLNVQQGKVDASTRDAVMEVHTASAYTSLRISGGRAQVSSVDGDIYIAAEDAEGRFTSVSGNLQISGTRSRIRAESGSGTIELDWRDGDAEASTVNGSITASGDRFRSGRFESYSGNIRFESALGSSGNLDVRAHQGSVDVEMPASTGDVFVSTETGGIRVTGEGLDRGRFESEGGDIRFEGTVGPDGALDVQTKGRVELVLPDDVDANFRIESGGRIQNAFGPDPSGTGRPLTFTKGKGGAWISVTTDDDVLLLRRQARPRPSTAGPDSLYGAILGRIGTAETDASIQDLKNLVDTYPTYAPAYHQLALLYQSKHTIQDRQRAERALLRAMRLAPDNAAYQLAWGNLLWSQGFWQNSGRHFEEVLDENHDSAPAAYGAGRSAFQEFLFHVDGGQKWAKETEEARKLGIERLSRAIELDPAFRASYYDLGRLFLEAKQPEGLVRIGKLLLSRFPDDKDALLFTALGHQLAQREEEAAGLYERAMEQMGPEERRVMEVVDLVASEEEAAAIGGWGEWRAQMIGREGENPERTRFWRKQDPLYLTDYNERRMEHYGRVAFANLAYGQPSRGIPGWQTDMGRTYIKFGRYIARGAGYRGETWVYEGFSIDFIGDGLDRWSFSPGGVSEMGIGGGGFIADRVTSTQPPFTSSWGSGRGYQETAWYASHAYRSEYLHRLRLSSAAEVRTTTARHVFEDRPPRYVDPYRQRKYALPHQVARFRDGDGYRVEVSYALPVSRVHRDARDGFVHLENGLFLFDSEWDEVGRSVDTVYELEPLDDEGIGAGYLLAEASETVRRRPSNVVIEARDIKTATIGWARDLEPSHGDSVLTMSDLLLASEIRPDDPAPTDRSQLRIRPNPLRIYEREQPIQLYFETYGLARGGFGRTRYEVSYRIGWPEEDEMDPALFPELDDPLVPDGKQFVQVEVVREQVPVEVNLGDDEGGRMAELIRSELSRPGRVIDYRVTYAARKPRVFEFGPPRDRRVWETAVTAEYLGEREDDLTYLAIDARDVPPGVHKLTVTVKDLVGKRETSRSVLLRLLGEKGAGG